MDLTFDYQLKPEQFSNPVLHISTPNITIPKIGEEEVAMIFNHKKSQLKTWGAVNTSHCHFIAVQKQTPLHIDPRYPRYSHQLILYVDGFVTRGIDKVETILKSGMYHVLDGHSPHQLFYTGAPGRMGHYVAVAFDSYSQTNEEQVLGLFKEYLKDIQLTDNLNGKNL